MLDLMQIPLYILIDFVIKIKRHKTKIHGEQTENRKKIVDNYSCLS